MRAKIGIAVVVSALTIVVVARQFGVSRALASGDDDKAAIVTLESRLVAAYSKKDVNAVMAFYVDDKDAVFFRGHSSFPTQCEFNAQTQSGFLPEP
jgi:hypothetical protein